MLLRLLNPSRRRYRWPIKLVFLAAILVFVHYPDPRLMVRHARHWSDLGALIDPDEPALGPMVAGVERELEERPGILDRPQDVQRVVQRVVYMRIPYEWDWVTWGCVDYIPTVRETVEQGREDCDGRAVVAASVLRKLGYEAHLVTDGSHMWVRTKSGDSMAPMKTASGRTLVTTAEAGIRIDPRAVLGARALLIDWPKNLAYGAAVFPVLRVAIIAAAVLLVLLPRRPRWAWALIGAALVIGGLFAWRQMCADPWNNSLSGAWLGLSLCGLGGLAAARSGSKPMGGDGRSGGEVPKCRQNQSMQSN